ncbi:hypothetical protein BDV24DRAFT_169547 [Aspergillus arachidicola]|uniref:Uncharacterized protein n=1 Tax=Aspergillus arachidicola TaxID=656916 RepID=A0A5N6XQT0_9EURO|nr:hypothetical protein BDV24DRAFT_169547 [Aspergillus arachidicola]
MLTGLELAYAYDSMYNLPWTSDTSRVVSLEEQKELLEYDQQMLRDIACKCPFLASIEMAFLPPTSALCVRYEYAKSTQRHLQAVLSALTAARSTQLPIERVQIDLHHTIQSADALGLRQQLTDGLFGVVDLQLRGQYRFWETALELDIFTRMASFTLGDTTVMYDSLHTLLRYRGHRLRRVTLDRVCLLPYPQIGYLRFSGTRQQTISWLLIIKTEASRLLENETPAPLPGTAPVSPRPALLSS